MLLDLRNKTRRGFVISVIAAFLSLGTLSSAQAAIVTPGQAVQAQAQNEHLEKVQAFLARADVQNKLQALGVDLGAAKERAAALSPEELAMLSGKIDKMPAGGLLEVLGVILVVLIVLEFLGVTNVFTRV